MESKEQEQQAPLLVVVMVPTHGLMLMELFGSLVVVVMLMTALVLRVSVLIFFFDFENGRNQQKKHKLN
jgi:hypothetical protein